MKATTYQLGDFFKLPNPGVRAYFDHVVSGNPEVYQTPFYGKPSNIDPLIQSWLDVLDSLRHEWPTLWDYEVEMASKVGPMSYQLPLSRRLDDVSAYYEGVSGHWEPITDSATDAVCSEYSRAAGLRSRTACSVVQDMRLSTNSGSPYFTKRRRVVADTFSSTLRFNGQSVYQDDYQLCATLGWRGQEGGRRVSDVKQRVVWMFPFILNIEELRVYQPLIAALQRTGLAPSWISMEAVDKSITQLMDTKGDSDLIVCTDFSKFDQHFGIPLQNGARKILSQLFRGDPVFDHWDGEIFPQKYNIPIALSSTLMFHGPHGMASGSGGTNADESLAHRALQHEAALAATQSLNPNSLCLGDDGVLSYPGVKVDDVIRSYTRHGLEMNESKQYASTQDCVYLRRWHHIKYRKDGVAVGVYPTCRALGRLIYQERFFDPDVWGPKAVALRQLSILENVKYHPLKEQFVQFCMKGDKYRLGLDIPNFLDHIESEARKLTDVMPDFLGYTKSEMLTEKKGISNWWIVQYLKSLR